MLKYKPYLAISRRLSHFNGNSYKISRKLLNWNQISTNSNIQVNSRWAFLFIPLFSHFIQNICQRQSLEKDFESRWFNSLWIMALNRSRIHRWIVDDFVTQWTNEHCRHIACAHNSLPHTCSHFYIVSFVSTECIVLHWIGLFVLCQPFQVVFVVLCKPQQSPKSATSK